MDSEKTRPPPLAVVLDGTIPTVTAAQVASAALDRALLLGGYRVESHRLASLNMSPCSGCYGCWLVTPGACVKKDETASVGARGMACDLLVFFSPITFGGFSSRLKNVMDRMIGMVSPFQAKMGAFTHHPRRYARTPVLLGVGLLDAPRPAWERTFGMHIERLAADFESPGYAAVTLVGTSEAAEAEKPLGEALARAGGVG